MSNCFQEDKKIVLNCLTVGEEVRTLVILETNVTEEEVLLDETMLKVVLSPSCRRWLRYSALPDENEVLVLNDQRKDITRDQRWFLKVLGLRRVHQNFNGRQVTATELLRNYLPMYL